MRIRLSDHFTYPRLLRFVLPSIVMMVFTSIYGVVDGFFVSNYVGKVPFAALNFVMPLIMVLGGMGFMVGTGGSALVAMELGCGNKERANRYFTIMVEFTVLLGVALTAVGLVLIRPFSIWLGATPEMLDDCVLYGRITIGFTTSFMLQNVFQSFLAAAEKPKLGLWVTVAAGVTNAILDWLFIAVFRWGLAGAALATGIGQCVGGILPLIYFLRPNSSLLRLAPARLELRPLRQACVNGSSELMSNISSSVVSLLYNYQLMRLLGEDGVSAFGVLMYVRFVFLAISIGYSVGSAPLVSFHFGAGNQAELKNLLRKSMALMFGSGAALTVLGMVLATPLARIFVGYDADLVNLTVYACYPSAFAFLLAGFNIFASGFFTALNNGGISALISFLRTLVFQTSFILLLPVIIGANGIWWATTLAEVAAFLISMIFLIAKRKRYHYL
ncbi:MAG: MATE family efflux transporter [Oscillospiraceae bacterium]|nr:MATE family efflux transporter [Oscillospiraceae bacterium]